MSQDYTDFRDDFFLESGVSLSNNQAVQLMRHYGDPDLALMHLSVIEVGNRSSQKLVAELLERDPLGISLDPFMGNYSHAA